LRSFWEADSSKVFWSDFSWSIMVPRWCYASHFLLLIHNIRVTKWVCKKKITQNAAQPVFLSKLMHNFYRRKIHSTKIWATTVIFTNLSNENNCPKGENLPNLVILHYIELPK
jgi:hypothetical protein